MTDRYLMLYCATPSCAVNTFEHFDTGECPGCGQPGRDLPDAGGAR